MIQFQAKYLKLLAPFMAKGDIRYYLCAIHIEPHPDGGAILVATDGHKMMIVRDATAICKEKFTFKFNRLALASCKDDMSCHINTVTQRLVITGGIFKDEQYIQPNKCAVEYVKDHRFPNWKRVVPKFSDLKPTIGDCFNAALLASAIQAGNNPRKYSPVRLWSNGDVFSSVIIQFELVPEAMAIVMPMRGYLTQTQSLKRMVENFGHTQVAV